MKSAPAVLKFEANRLRTDEFWLEFIILTNGLEANITGMGFGLEGDTESRAFNPVTLPITIAGTANNRVRCQVQTPTAAGLTTGPANLRTAQTFFVRLYFQGVAGQITVASVKTIIDPKRTDDDTYDGDVLYPEPFQINIDTDAEPETIDGELVFPSLVTAEFSKVVPLANFEALNDLPAPGRDTFYNVKNNQFYNDEMMYKGLYFRDTAGEIQVIQTITKAA